MITIPLDNKTVDEGKYLFIKILQLIDEAKVIEVKMSSFPIPSELTQWMDPGITHQRLLTSQKTSNMIIEYTTWYKVNLLKKLKENYLIKYLNVTTK